MSTQAQVGTSSQDPVASCQNSSASTGLGFAVIGCLVAGGVGILKALSMETGSGVLLCLLGSVAAFGLVFYIYLRND